MKKMIRLAALPVLLGLLFGFAQPVAAYPKLPASALYVRSENPNKQQLVDQMYAIYNPAIPSNKKREVIYGAYGSQKQWIDGFLDVMIPRFPMGDNVKVKFHAMKRVNKKIIVIPLTASAPGMGTYKPDYTWVREGGLWKLDLMQTCAKVKNCAR